jgi:regulator of protease activity HflC (stomatin/prohibitin superfamily)
MEGLLDGSLIQMLTAVGGLLFTGVKTIQFVQEGSRGLKLRFGKVVRSSDGTPKVVEPGFVWMIPFVGTYVSKR